MIVQGGRPRRGGGRFGLASLLFPTISLLLPTICWAMTIGGRFGLEVDGLGEEYQRLELSDGIETQFEESPVQSREATTLALLELRADVGSQLGSWFHLTEVGRAGLTRQRNSLITEVGLRSGASRLRLENQWDSQGGEEEPASGMQDHLTLTIDRDALPLTLRSQLRLGVIWSDSDEDSLDAIYDYRTVRGQLQLRRDLTRQFELRGLFGVRRKEAFRKGSGSYDSWFTEGEGSGTIAQNHLLETILRLENRTYDEEVDGTPIPSSKTLTTEIRYECGVNEVWHPFTDHRYEVQDYRESTDLFQDHSTWRGRLGADLYWNRLMNRSTESEDLLVSDLRFRMAGQMELFRATQPAEEIESLSQTYDSFGMILGIAREGAESFWFDLTFEAGRRDYENAGGSTSLTIGGLDFSLSTSDYVYLRGTLLADWSPASWLRMEGFLQWDEELHDVASDDFRLWIVNLSLTYPF